MHTLGPWQYDINPTSTEAIIVDWEGYTVVELSALENSTCASDLEDNARLIAACLLYTSPSPRDLSTSRMPSSA